MVLYILITHNAGLQLNFQTDKETTKQISQALSGERKGVLLTRAVVRCYLCSCNFNLVFNLPSQKCNYDI
jgi:hypothetical protein